MTRLRISRPRLSVPSQNVTPAPFDVTGRFQALDNADGEGVVRRQQRRSDRGDQDQREYHRAHQGCLAANEASKHLPNP